MACKSNLDLRHIVPCGLLPDLPACPQRGHPQQATAVHQRFRVQGSTVLTWQMPALMAASAAAPGSFWGQMAAGIQRLLCADIGPRMLQHGLGEGLACRRSVAHERQALYVVFKRQGLGQEAHRDVQPHLLNNAHDQQRHVLWEKQSKAALRGSSAGLMTQLPAF